ncbi:MAG: zinc-ribbon domain-containing protein [Ruminococcus sp.]
MEMKEMFEKAGDSVSKFAKSVGDNSKKLASKVKLNKTIHDLEKIKETAYTEIGKQYFLSHADAVEEPYAEWALKIVEANEQITKCKQEIAALDDLLICPVCGAEIAEGQKFCSHCGAKNEAKPEPAAEAKTETVPDEIVEVVTKDEPSEKSETDTPDQPSAS